MIATKPMAVGTAAAHGESPLWSPREKALYWVDIQNAKLHRMFPESGDEDEWSMPRRICSIALRERGGLIAALEDGIYFIELDPFSVELAAKPETLPWRVRFNDGKCDRRGRFFAGTMDENEKAALGVLYRFDASGQLVAVQDELIIANGPAFSPDGDTLYLVDSARSGIFQFAYDQNTGTLGAGKTFLATEHLPGKPDGITVDSEGYLWVAYWGGWHVSRHAPDGTVERIIDVPVSQPSSCMFGGDDLSTLYVTSASKGLSPAAHAHEPQAGCVFALDVHVHGIPEPPFAG